MWGALRLNNPLPLKSNYGSVAIQEEYRDLVRFLLGLTIATLLLVTYIHQAAQMAVIRSQTNKIVYDTEMVRWDNAMLEAALAEETNIPHAMAYARQVGLIDSGSTHYLGMSGVAIAETQASP